MQRLFNILWSTCLEKKHGELDVIPFYFSIRDSDQTLGMFATDFFAEKDLYTTMAGYIKEDNWHFMWKIASEAPATIGRLKGVKNRPNHR